MNNFAAILRGLQAVIAARAARDRTLTVLLVAVWGRIARMGTRLERLVALWRAGTLPKSRTARVRTAGKRAAKKPTFPTARAWLVRKLGYEAVAYGSQLQHLLTDKECVAFLEAVPQAGRILRPLLRMLSGDPLPEVVRKAARVVPVAAPVAALEGGVVVPVSHFFGA